MFRVMALGVLRDRGALVLAFVLPPLIFIIFAAIFSGTSEGRVELRVAMGAERPEGLASRLETALSREETLHLLPGLLPTRAAVAARVEAGQADAGLFVRHGPEAPGAPPLVVLVDPAKLLAGTILAGQVQAMIARDLPDLTLARAAASVGALAGGFSPAQEAQLAAALQAMAQQPPAPEPAAALVATELLGGRTGSDPTITYYAGAVAILFIMFSALQGAASLIDERRSGILDRVAVGPAGTDVVVLGKFLFLTAQGMIQVALIFAAAVLVYDLEIGARLGAWLAITLAAAAGVAGLGLAIAALCTSKQQAQTLSTFVVLISSAIGGSMVPRFMMPSWLQDLGWLTPNAWTVEAYHAILWRGVALGELATELGLLTMLALAGVGASLALSRRRLVS